MIETFPSRRPFRRRKIFFFISIFFFESFNAYFECESRLQRGAVAHFQPDLISTTFSTVFDAKCVLLVAKVSFCWNDGTYYTVSG